MYDEEANGYYADQSSDDAQNDCASARRAANHPGSRLQWASGCNRARVRRNYSRSEETACAKTPDRIAVSINAGRAATPVIS